MKNNSGVLLVARFFAALVIYLFTLSALAGQKTVEQWGAFELAFNGPTNGNPFTDVQFSARFTQGTHSVEASGFYDGDGIYRVRLCRKRRANGITSPKVPSLNSTAKPANSP